MSVGQSQRSIGYHGAEELFTQTFQSYFGVYVSNVHNGARIMTYSGLPRIRNRLITAGTWDMTGRQRLSDDLRVRFNDSAFSRARNDGDVPLYSTRVSDASIVTQVCTVLL